MTSLVILDPSLAAQVRENPQGLEGLDVRWVGDDPHAFLQAIRRCNPDVLVVNLELLPGDGAQAWLQRALDESSAGLLLCLYRFAPRSVLGSVPPERARTVKAPVSLSRLKAQLMSLIVSDLLRGSGDDTAAARAPRREPARDDASGPEPRGVLERRASLPPRATLAGATAVLGEVPAPRYSTEQLGRLLEMRSSIQCECPNHVAEILQSLRGFEEYARGCANRDERDARVHRVLYESTARARALMEEAMALLIDHERIAL